MCFDNILNHCTMTYAFFSLYSVRDVGDGAHFDNRSVWILKTKEKLPRSRHMHDAVSPRVATMY